MASTAHAIYCFEVLSAGYQQDQHPDLQAVVDLYDEWQKVNKSAEPSAEKNEEAQSRGQTTDQVEEQHDLATGQLQLPTVSRLRDATPSNSSGSSISTPSSTSVNSSSTQLTSDASINEVTPSYASRLPVTESFPMFVTWNAHSRSGHKSLRGCIGTFEALPLERGLESYALTSAFEDSRFSPIPQSQIPNLSCSLTLLADFEECDNALDWELGKHGIRISFTHRSRRHGATYLPYVASEQGWTQEETLESLMRKAGWESPYRRFSRAAAKPWEEVRDFRVIRYTGLYAGATYSEWQEWQKWAKQKHSDLWDQ